MPKIETRIGVVTCAENGGKSVPRKVTPQQVQKLNEEGGTKFFAQYVGSKCKVVGFHDRIEEVKQHAADVRFQRNVVKAKKERARETYAEKVETQEILSKLQQQQLRNNPFAALAQMKGTVN